MSFLEHRASYVSAAHPFQTSTLGLTTGSSNAFEDGVVARELRFSNRAAAEPGNSRGDALKISQRDFRKSERVGSDEGNDYYTFKQTRKTRVSIEVENEEFVLGPSLTFTLQNSKGNRIETDKVSGGDDGKIVRKLAKGTYYIKVSSGGESVPYKLEFESEGVRR